MKSNKSTRADELKVMDPHLRCAARLLASRYEYLWLAPETRSQLIDDVRSALEDAYARGYTNGVIAQATGVEPNDLPVG